MTRTARVWSEQDIRALGTKTNLRTAASIFGIGRTKAFDLARKGTFPVPLIRVGHVYVVPVAPILRALGLEREELSA
jgi:hypothetical protein